MQTTSPRHHYAPTVVWPFALIGLGIVALLVNTGGITWDSLARVAGLWPVLLILVGIELIISRSLRPAIALTTNVAISGVALVSLLALLISGASFGIGGWWSTASVQTITRSAPVATLTQAQLDLNYGAATVAIHGGSTGNDLYRARLTYAGNPAPTVSVDRATGTVHVNRGNRSPFQILPSNTREQVDLVLNNQVSWAVTLNTGASQQTIDLRSLTLTSLRINGGASSAEIDLPQPSGAVPVQINGGAMSLRMVAPTAAAIQMTSNGGFNSMTCDGQSVSGFGRQQWQSPNFMGSMNRFDVQFSGGASSVRLERW
jgi:hypothetical protein